MVASGSKQLLKDTYVAVRKAKQFSGNYWRIAAVSCCVDLLQHLDELMNRSYFLGITV